MKKFADAVKAKMARATTWLKTQGSKIRKTKEAPAAVEPLPETEADVTDATDEKPRATGFWAWTKRTTKAVFAILATILGMAAMVVLLALIGLVWLVLMAVFVVLHLARKILSLVYLGISFVVTLLLDGWTEAKLVGKSMGLIVRNWRVADALDAARLLAAEATSQIQITIESVTEEKATVNPAQAPKGRPTPKQRKHRPAKIQWGGDGGAAAVGA